MIGAMYRDKVDTHVQEAISQGARVLTGGKRPKHLRRGYFYEPTVLTQVHHSARGSVPQTFLPGMPDVPGLSYSWLTG